MVEAPPPRAPLRRGCSPTATRDSALANRGPRRHRPQEGRCCAGACGQPGSRPDCRWPDTIVDGCADVLGPEGTTIPSAILDLPAARGRAARRHFGDHLPAFDPARARALPGQFGYWPELCTAPPGALRGNPGASMAALGGQAEWSTATTRLIMGYGRNPRSGKPVESRGKVLMLGAPLDTMRRDPAPRRAPRRFPDKRVVRYGGTDPRHWRWIRRWFEEFDTSDPPDGLPRRLVSATIVEAFLATGRGERASRRGELGRPFPPTRSRPSASGRLDHWGRMRQQRVTAGLRCPCSCR